MASRALTNDMKTACQASVLRPFYLLEVSVASSVLRWTTFTRDVSWNSQTWLSNGYIKNISELSQSKDLGADGILITIAGEPSAIVSLALSEFRQNKPGTLYLGFLSPTHTVITDPYPLFSGRVDRVTLDDAPSEAVVEIVLESHFINQNKACGLRYTHESQQSLFPGDLGFEYVPQLQDWNGYFGKPEKPKKKNRHRRGKQQ